MTKHQDKRFGKALRQFGLAAVTAVIMAAPGFGPGAIAAAEKIAPPPATPAAQKKYDGYTDIVLGNKDAPIKVIEYASMTCGHCAAFHNDVFKDFKKNYLDTGKASYVLRNFVTNPADLVASMVARCAPTQRFYAYTDLFLTRQATWIKPWQDMGNLDPKTPLVDVAIAAKMDQFVRPAGMSLDKFKACMADDGVQEDLMRQRQEGITKFDIKGTPTIIINGKVYDGEHKYAAFEKAILAAKK